MKLLTLENLCFSIFLFFLPFAQALTINIGFPLKISEVFLVLILILWSVRMYSLNLNFTFIKIHIILFIFITLLLTSTLINFFATYNYKLGNFSRVNPYIDSLLKFGYAILATMALAVTAFKIKHNEKFIKYLWYGGIICCCYSWYLLLSGLLKLPVVLLPGMDKYPQVMALPIGNFIRSGTFKEGNYLGFYILLLALLATYQKKRLLSIFFFVSILTSFSTVSFACVIIFLVIYLYRSLRQGNIIYTIIIGAVLSGILMLVIFNEGLRSVFINKIILSEEDAAVNEIYSKLDRLNVAQVGLRLFYDNPFFGVGLANYGLHYDNYNLLEQWVNVSSSKRIPNNVYIEILCEAGIFSFIAFILFLSGLYKKIRGKKYRILNITIIICFIYFFAFPTFTILYVWVFWGIFVGVINADKLKYLKQNR